jgi:5-methylcytosine-specific restriction endonuclease McrA
VSISAKTREQVRERAGRRCEYCRKPEGVSAYAHQVEHVIAVKHDGPSTLDNLAWACFQCNNYKGPDIASYDKETNTLTPLYNPRQDRWDDHFFLEDAVIVGKTPTGRVTVRILQMNHPDQIETRAYLLRAGLW